LTVPTALVIQGPKGVRTVYPIPAEQLEQMLRTVREEIRLDGIKIGAACDVGQVEVIADFLESQKDIPVVLDPVLSAKNGYSLLSQDGLKMLIQRILPLVGLITPNIEEAGVFTDRTVVDRETMREAAQIIKESGVKNILLKGGHLSGEPADLFLDEEGRVIWWERQRINREVHGTGCTLSSLILVFLAHGYSSVEAFHQSEKMIEEMLKNSYQIAPEGYYYTSLTHLTSQLSKRWVDSDELLHKMEI
jgi:hydroxymethylpyrimidine/phosphomethylpyrimidine kinase